MTAQRLLRIRQRRPALQPQALHGRQQPFYETATAGAATPLSYFPPQDVLAQHALGVIIRRPVGCLTTGLGAVAGFAEGGSEELLAF
jgi:hypothetical protein